MSKITIPEPEILPPEPKPKRKGNYKAGPGGAASPPPGHMTSKEAGVILHRASGMSLADSALAAGYQCTTTHSADSLATKIIKKHITPNSEFREILQEHSVDMRSVAKKLSELLHAKTTVRVGRDDSKEVPDNRTQLQTCELLTKLMDVEPPKKVEINETLTFEQRILQLTRVKVEHAGNEEF